MFQLKHNQQRKDKIYQLTQDNDKLLKMQKNQ